MNMKPGEFQVGGVQNRSYPRKSLSPIDGQSEFTVFLTGLGIDMGMGFHTGRQP